MRPRLSRYEILGRLASGGMADVWMARAIGPSGFEKRVVLKTLLPGLASNAAFVSMFITEARVAAMLNHPNCVQIFDFGEEGGVTYLAMEFIEGFSLSRILRRMKKPERPPVEVVVRVLMDVCSGLEAAHQLTDSAGKHLALVHRDVSADNVMVSFSGQTKLLDFGIARAQNLEMGQEKTRPGMVKGKFGYMAPEHLRGETVDGRADLFSLGVTGYRALTGKRPFVGKTDTVIAMSVLNDTPKPIRSLRPEVPATLEHVIARALSKPVEERYASARAMRDALETSVPKVADTEGVGAWMERLWPRDADERRVLIDLAAGRSEDTSAPALNAAAAEEITDGGPRGTDVDLGDGGRRKPWLVAGIAAVALAAVATVGVVVFGSNKAAESLDAGLAVAVEPDAGAEPALLAAAEPDAGLDLTELASDVDAGEPPADLPNVAAQPGRLVLTTTPSVAVFVGGRARGRTPVTLTLPEGVWKVRLVDRGTGIDRVVTVRVRGNDTSASDVKFGKGTVDLRISPWANVSIDGKAIGPTPLPPQELYEGRHVVELSNPELNKTRKLEVILKAGEKKTVREAL